MTRKEFLALCEAGPVLLDGATGTNLQQAGMPSGICPEQWILEHPTVMEELQQNYLEAGTQILYAPTFTANAIKLREYGLEDQLVSMNKDLVALTKRVIKASGKKAYVAGDLTMTGKQLAPVGELSLETLISVYKEQITCLVEAGVDLLVVETMMSLGEARAALLAAREVCDLPVMVSLTFREDQRTFYGTSPEAAVVVLQAMGADAVGANCSTGPEGMEPILARMKKVARIPLMAKPNGGMPVLLNGETVYPMTPEEFAGKMEDLRKAGANCLGGCCGTTPAHIQALCQTLTGKKGYVPGEGKNFRGLSTERDVTPLPLEGPFVVIGERINPTGKKNLMGELKEGSMDLVCAFGKEQEEAGAKILDVNVGMNGIDEQEIMCEASAALQENTSLPLCFDTSHISVMEAVLRGYPGRALLNSVSGEESKTRAMLSLAKKYGAMYILLPLSQGGLPKDETEKREIIHKVLAIAEEIGLSKEDVLVDGLVNTVGANPMAAKQTLETLRYCHDKLQVGTVCGLSNISFGLPDRGFINAAFLTLAVEAGLTAAIANPTQELLMRAAVASDLLCGKEEADQRYIDRVNSIPFSAGESKLPIQKIQETGHPLLWTMVVEGNRKKIEEETKKELERGTEAKDILDELLIPAITEVGNRFDRQEYFLPQLIAGAETMEKAVKVLEPALLSKGGVTKAGTVIIATVAGDIHDIGKNLVALMLKNYGFTVIDLGKDVPTEAIMQRAKKENADLICVSALMTTTMMEMKKIVQARNEAKLRAKIMIGGAVVTESFREEIQAEGYSKDAAEAVQVARKLLGIGEENHG